MIIIFRTGDIFTDPDEVPVNTVNCVDVMGKGVTLEFKHVEYPLARPQQLLLVMAY